MDLKFLSTFMTIVSEGSFSKAAEKLGYTQSAITFQMGQLEQELHMKLFEKVGRRMVLTKAGEGLIPYVEEVLSSVEKLRYVQRDLTDCRGDLRIGVGETLMCYKIPAILKEFHRRAPKAQIYLQSMNCYDIRDALMEGSLDLGVFYADVGGFGSNLAVYSMGSYPVTLVASPETAKQFPDFMTPNRNLDVPFLINEKNCIFRQMFEGYLKEKSITLDHTIELWSIPTIKNLVKNDVGVTFLPKFAAEEELSRGELVEIPCGVTNREIHAVCAHYKNKWVSPLMEMFISLCEVQG